jgi:hypothetical protein
MAKVEDNRPAYSYFPFATPSMSGNKVYYEFDNFGNVRYRDIETGQFSRSLKQ